MSVSKIKLAEVKGCHRAQVTRSCKAGGPLAAAVLADGRVDLNHPATQRWLGNEPAAAPPKRSKKRASKAATPPEPAKRQRKRRAQPTAPPLDKRGYSEDLASWTLDDIVETYGTAAGYREHLEALYKREQTRKARLSNEEKEGTLISRDLVRTHIFGIINGGFERLLRDVPRTLASRAHALVNSGGSVEEIEKLIRDGNSSVLKPARDKVLSNLRRKRKQTQPEDDEDE